MHTIISAYTERLNCASYLPGSNIKYQFSLVVFQTVAFTRTSSLHSTSNQVLVNPLLWPDLSPWFSCYKNASYFKIYKPTLALCTLFDWILREKPVRINIQELALAVLCCHCRFSHKPRQLVLLSNFNFIDFWSYTVVKFSNIKL